MDDYKSRENQDVEPTAPQQGPGAETGGTEEFSEVVDQSDAAFLSESSGSGRSTAAVVLTLLLVGAGAIAFMRFKSSPQQAAAAIPEAKNANATINAFLSDGGKDMKKMQELLKNTEKLCQRFLSYPLRKQVKLEDLATNPFRFAAPKEVSVDPDAEARRLAAAKDKERAAVSKAAGDLRLQSIMYGSSMRTCMIANKGYTEGQEVEGFTIEKIAPDSVIVKKAGLRFELRIQR